MAAARGSAGIRVFLDGGTARHEAGEVEEVIAPANEVSLRSDGRRLGTVAAGRGEQCTASGEEEPALHESLRRVGIERGSRGCRSTQASEAPASLLGEWGAGRLALSSVLGP